MLKKFILALLFLAPISALADDVAPLDHAGAPERGPAVCYDYDYNPRTCNNLWYCTYDYYSNTCNYLDDNGGGQGYCSDYDRNPRLCESQYDCRYDRRTGRCEDRGTHDPHPSSCSYYRDYRSCDAVQDCFWDRRLNRCVDAR